MMLYGGIDLDWAGGATEATIVLGRASSFWEGRHASEFGSDTIFRSPAVVVWSGAMKTGLCVLPLRCWCWCSGAGASCNLRICVDVLSDCNLPRPGHNIGS